MHVTQTSVTICFKCLSCLSYTCNLWRTILFFHTLARPIYRATIVAILGLSLQSLACRYQAAVSAILGLSLQSLACLCHRLIKLQSLACLCKPPHKCSYSLAAPPTNALIAMMNYSKFSQVALPCRLKKKSATYPHSSMSINLHRTEGLSCMSSSALANAFRQLLRPTCIVRIWSIYFDNIINLMLKMRLPELETSRNISKHMSILIHIYICEICSIICNAYYAPYNSWW